MPTPGLLVYYGHKPSKSSNDTQEAIALALAHTSSNVEVWEVFGARTKRVSLSPLTLTEFVAGSRDLGRSFYS